MSKFNSFTPGPRTTWQMSTLVQDCRLQGLVLGTPGPFLLHRSDLEKCFLTFCACVPPKNLET